MLSEGRGDQTGLRRAIQRALSPTATNLHLAKTPGYDSQSANDTSEARQKSINGTPF